MEEEDLIKAMAEQGIIRMEGMLLLLSPLDHGIGFGVKSLDGRYLLANRALASLVGVEAGRMAGQREGDFLPTQAVDSLARCDEQIFGGSLAASVEVTLPLDDGDSRCLWLKFPVFDTHQELRSIASIVHELSPPESGRFRKTVASLLKSNRELQLTVDELKQAVSTDRLTGTWNRRRLEECVRGEMDRLNRYQHAVCLLLIDIDHFKQINDRNGHRAGDEVLQALAALLRARLRTSDSLARWGGEEFVVVSPNTTGTTAAVLAERLREHIARATFPTIGRMSVSIGVAECLPGETWEQWFERADRALYQAKEKGRNRVELAPLQGDSRETRDYVVANFVQLVWRPAYECGDFRIDDGHRQLFADANDLLAAILSGEQSGIVDEIVDRLLGDVLQHFIDEEEVIIDAGFPGIEEHVVLHRELVDKALRLVDNYRSGRQGVGDVFQFLAYDVVTRHMLGADRQFFDCLRAPAGDATAASQSFPAAGHVATPRAGR
ncbi:diguanylate cyclase [Accumulibacter sp.]|uniref:diguanylate cyclase n=1 Tax=Accumulibacter sp. TaxID=2053492 RepID=UPI0025E64D6F|nr:diguanylate cyclase [Accumulibacter sp.]MCM8596270.1 diguanylate cyclase [Accumulibacter sp.]MCM8627201.1 diguanylate cyclase [Accumulibacter sp.]MDS4050419.1 diguanylate cyclase [Accumulibacter sp.]